MSLEISFQSWILLPKQYMKTCECRVQHHHSPHMLRRRLLYILPYRPTSLSICCLQGNNKKTSHTTKRFSAFIEYDSKYVVFAALKVCSVIVGKFLARTYIFNAKNTNMIIGQDMILLVIRDSSTTSLICDWNQSHHMNE